MIEFTPLDNDIIKAIPMIPMDEQLKIVKQYQALRTELVELQKQEKALRSRIESIMEGEDLHDNHRG